MYPQLKLEILNPTPIDVTSYLTSHSLDRGDVSQVGASGVDGIVSSLSFTLGNSGQYQCMWDSEAVVDSETVLDSERTFDSEDDVCLLFAYLFQTEPTLARDSFSPRDSGSRFNQPTPLLYPNREVVFYVDDIERWRGYIREIKPGRSKVDVVAYDPAKTLQDAYIYTSKEYGSEVGVPAEDVIQQIIDDNIGIYPEYSLYTPISPSFLVTPYKVEYESVWDAIQEVASMIGWYLGYRYIDGQFRLTFLEPPRLKDTPDFELDADKEIYTQDLAISDIDVRNYVKVTYRDSNVGTRQSVTVQDNDSIALFGKRSMEIEEADTPLINTGAEALRFATAVLHDLSSLPATTNLNLPYMPQIDTFSTVAVRNPLISSTIDFYAVESVRHYGEPTRLRTEIVCSGKVIGGRGVWLGKETRKGRTKPITGGDVINNPIYDDIVVASKEAPLDVRRAAHFICDGVDDHVQVQAAIDHCHTIGGGTVQLTKGTFSVTADQITLKNNVTLQGIGLSTIIKCPGAKTSGGKVLGARTLENVTIRNLAMEIIDLPTYVEEFTGDVYAVKHPTIRDLLLVEEYVEGYWIIASEKVIEHDKTTIYMNLSGMYRVYYNSQHTTRGISFGIDEEGDTDYVKNILIENVTITNPGDRGINILSSETISHNCKIKDVVVNNTPNAFIESFCFSGIKGLTCSENTSNYGDVGVMIIDCADVIIANNTIYKPATFGITVYASAYGANYVISNNNISDSNCGINIQGGKGTLITNNYVFRVTNQGICIAYGEAHTLQLNKITGLQYSTGVSIQPGVTDTYLANNDLSDTATKIDDQGTDTYFGPGNKV